MANDVSAKNTVVDLGDKVAIFDELGRAVVTNEIRYDAFLEKEAADFYNKFRVVNDSRMLSNPNETFSEELDLIRVIERLSDGQLFGFEYSEDISEYGEAYVNPNGEEHGFDFEWDDDYFPQVYVFLPVTPFTVTGYEVNVTE